jgi:tetrahydromethanopterin S-methyltransferase subunit G
MTDADEAIDGVASTDPAVQELAERVDALDQRLDAAVSRVAERVDDLEDRLDELQTRECAQTSGGRMGYLMGAIDEHGAEQVDNNVDDISQREADAAALYRAYDDLSDQGDVWRLEDRMKAVLASLRGVDETEYQDGEIPNNRLYRACEKLEELSNGAILFDETDLEGGRRLRRL